jgi:catechol 2,3-dioxygenase-like lactoylglutathione lyase family enzyme
MSDSQSSKQSAAGAPSAAAVETKLEVVVIPVSDVERSKRFYQSLGWRLDADFAHGEEWRVVQLTPPGSACSILFGKGFTAASPGSVKGLFLSVNDVEAARAELIGRDVDVSGVFHFEHDMLNVIGTQGRVPGVDPQRRSYLSWASFSDPDGNTWMLQEITARLPGRGFSNLDIATLTGLLREAEKLHGDYTATAPKHHWSGWYAAYIVARERGRAPEQAAQDGATFMKSSTSEE